MLGAVKHRMIGLCHVLYFYRFVDSLRFLLLPETPFFSYGLYFYNDALNALVSTGE